MGKILVSGIVNSETSVQIDEFPLEYIPIDYGPFKISCCVSGVGFNIAKALKVLGSEADLFSLTGSDMQSFTIRRVLEDADISLKYVVNSAVKATPESVVLCDRTGRRRIYCDLKDVQEAKIDYADTGLNIADYSLAILTNINFSRSLLKPAKQAGVPIITDVHVLRDLEDGYNREFMEHADILFLSNEAIQSREEEFCRELYRRYRCNIIVMGCGSRGALAYLGEADRFMLKSFPAVRGAVSTVGAGDALLSCFAHYYRKGCSAEECLQKAAAFAAYKIGEAGGSQGFIDESALEAVIASQSGQHN